MRTIAASAGVSLSMVHHYYGSKDELYDAWTTQMSVELDVVAAH